MPQIMGNSGWNEHTNPPQLQPQTRPVTPWKLRAHTYSGIVLQLEGDYREAIAATNDPHDAWMMLESICGSQQSGIQAVINAELT